MKGFNWASSSEEVIGVEALELSDSELSDVVMVKIARG